MANLAYRPISSVPNNRVGPGKAEEYWGPSRYRKPLGGSMAMRRMMEALKKRRQYARRNFGA